MSYPGNSSLAEDIQGRILTTFEQTLDLASKGSLREAQVGCDFILRLDALFEPAARLKERLEQGEGTLLVDDLRLSEAPSPEPAGSGNIFDLGDRAGASAADETAQEENVIDEEPPAGLMQSPAAAAPSEETFSDLEADELEAALDLSALSETETPAEADAEPIFEPEPAPVEEETAEVEAPPLADEPPAGQPDLPELPSHAEPAAALDAESEQRVQDLLGEGQTEFEDGEYQSAIDAWSRIFLIDIDHQEASRRIELARKLKAEVERQVEELFHEAVGQVEAGDFDSARAGFARVLEMQSSHLAAQEYLDKLESGSIETKEPPASGPDPAPAAAAGVGGVAGASAADASSVSGAGPAEPVSELDAIPGDELEIPDDLDVLSDVIPDAPAERSRPDRPSRDAKAKAPKSKGIKRSFLYIGGAVLVLATAVGWFLYTNFDDTFPNAGQPAPAQPRPRVDVIARAQQVFEEGNAELAIAQLRRLPPNHQRYAEAQALITQWESLGKDEGPAAETASAEQLTERDRLVGDAQAAFERREFLRSHELLTQAAAITVLGEEALQLQTAAVLELQPLRSEIEIFRQGEWGEALRTLWQIRESDPDNPDVRRLMVDSYYNLGVRDLQRRDPLAAADNLREALKLAGDDPEAERILRFAETYKTRPVDLLYRIFVKYLPFR